MKKKRLKKPKDRKLDITTLKHIAELLRYWAQNCDDYAAAALRSRSLHDESKRNDAAKWFAMAAADLEIANDIEDEIFSQRRDWKED